MAVDHNNPQSRDEEILIATIDEKEYDKTPQSRMEELLLELKETIEEGGGGGGTTNYNNLSNQPQVNGETLIGDKTGAELGLVDAEEGKGLSTNDYDDTEKAAVTAATSDITAMKDGTDLDSFGDVEVALLDKANVSDLGTAAAKDSTNVVTSGSTDLVESGAVKDAIDAAVASAYHHAGTKTVAQLTHDLLIAANEGNVYNITDSGTTTSDFIEGIGKTIDEGSNVGICKVGNTYMFDLLSGFVDTSNFVQKSSNAGLLKNDGTVNDEIEGDVATLKSGLTTLDNEVNGDATTYPYADVITIEDAVPANLADCSVNIEPVQDLHGYDKPWVGGAGKNKLPLVLADLKTANTDGTWNGNVYTINNGTITVNTDDGGNVTSIKTNGTFNANTTFNLLSDIKDVLAVGTDIIINGCPLGGGATRYVITANNVGNDTGDGVSGQVPSIVSKVAILIYASYNVDNLLFYPMVRLATETDATFAPYTNICPISGHTEVDVQRDGKNLFDGSVTNGYYINASGEYVQDGASAYSDLIKVPSNANVVFSGICTQGDAGTKRVHAYDADGNWISVVGAVKPLENNKPFSCGGVTPSNCAYVRLSYYGSTESTWASVRDKDIQLELGSTATPYVPYAGKTYTIALGDTVYGGTVDFDSGVMTVDRAVVDLGTLTWNKGSSSVGVRFYTTGLNSLMSHVTGGNELIKAICSDYARGTSNGSYTGINGEIADAGQFTAIVDNRYDDYTAEEFKTAMDGVQLCYELATPFTVQLTPQQIQLLKGQNTLTASTGDISVTVNGVSGAIGSVQEQVNDLMDCIGWGERKNILNPIFEQGSSLNATSTRIRCKNTIFVQEGKTYTFSASDYTNYKYSIDSCPTSAYPFEQSTIQYVGNPSGWQTQNVTFTAKNNGYVSIVIAKSNDANIVPSDISTLQLFFGTGGAVYVPYHPVIGTAVEELLEKVPDAPSTDGTYSLQVTVASGVPTYSWVSGS